MTQAEESFVEIIFREETSQEGLGCIENPACQGNMDCMCVLWSGSIDLSIGQHYLNRQHASNRMCKYSHPEIFILLRQPFVFLFVQSDSLRQTETQTS